MTVIWPDVIYCGYSGATFLTYIPKAENTNNYFLDRSRATATHVCAPWHRATHTSEAAISSVKRSFPHLELLEIREGSVEQVMKMATSSAPIKPIKMTIRRKVNHG